MTFTVIAAGDAGAAATAMENWRHINYGSPFLPVNSTGVSVDSTIDIGSSTRYFKDSYIDNGYFSNSVGIGTATPSHSLDIIGVAQTTSGFLVSQSGFVSTFANDGTGAYLDAAGANSLRFRTNAANRAIILSSGEFGIGTTSPEEIFQVETNFLVQDDGVVRWGQDVRSASRSNAGYLSWDTGKVVLGANESGEDLEIRSGNAAAIYCDSSQNVGIGTSSPDVKLEISKASSTNAELLKLTNSQHDTNNKGAVDLIFAHTMSSGEKTGRFRYEEAANNSDSANLYVKLPVSGVETDRLYIEGSSGNVGIGTTSPGAKLDVNSGTDNLCAIFESTDNGCQVDFVDSNGTASIEARNDFRFDVNNGVEALRIDSSGNVGIGTTSPSRLLHLYSTAAALEIEASNDSNARLILDAGATSDAQIELEDNNSSVWAFGMDSTNSNAFVFSNSGSLGSSDRMTISTGGDVEIAETLAVTNQPKCRAYKSGTQNITSEENVTFNQEDYDTGGVHDVSTNNHRFQGTIAGIWAFSFVVHHNSGGDFTTIKLKRFNSSDTEQEVIILTSKNQASGETETHSGVIKMDLDDYVVPIVGSSGQLGTGTKFTWVFIG